MNRALLRALILAPALAGTALVAALPGAAEAAIVKPLDLPALTRNADLVAVGVVSAKASRWVEGRIVTAITFQPSQVLKGTAGAELTIEVLGGEIEGIAQSVSGMASFEVGEESVVFLKRTAAVHQVVGLAQGKFAVRRDAAGVALVADLRGLTAARPETAGGPLALSPMAETQIIPLQRFVGEVASHLVAP